MLGADAGRCGARGRALVGDVALGKADRERLDRTRGQPRHHHQHRRRIDAAGEEHAEGHVRTLVQANALGQGGIEPGQGLLFTERRRPVFGQCRPMPALDDPPLAHDYRLAGQNPVDPGEDRLAAGRELHLHQLVAHRPHEARLDDAGFDQRARLGGKGKGARRLRVIERLDAERVARQNQAARSGIVHRHGVHAAQMLGKVEPVPAIEMQRHLAIRLGRKDRSDARRSAPGAARCSCRSRHWRSAPHRPARSSGWSPVARSMIARRVCTMPTSPER